jgi:phage-related minor tail protein
MSFDAGSIEASMTVKLDQFNRDMDQAEARVSKFESEKHEVKISAVFDTASMTRARKLFADLDQQISRDAAQRLRTNPQGSVLGSLNSLFSPHPVTGAPAAQQAGQQGLLGKMFSSPGGAGGGSTGGTNSSNNGGIFGSNSFLSGLIGRITGGGSSSDKAAQDAAAAQTAAAKSMADDSKRQTGLLQKALAGDRSAGGFGNGIAGGIGPGILGMGMKATGAIGIGGSLLGALPAALTGLGALGIGGVGIGASAALFKGIQSQITPVSQQAAQISQQQAAGLGNTAAGAQQIAQEQQALAQSTAALGPAMGSIYKSEQQISNTWSTFTNNFAPLFAGAMSSVASVFQKLQPALQGFFGNATKLIQPFIQGLGDVAAQVLPLLGQAFAAVAPLMRPMLDGIGALFTGLLPGLTTALKGAQPAVNALFGGLGIIGKGLGQMFTAFAPAIKASSVVLNSLLSLISALLPTIGTLASVFATALAPAFTAFAGTIKSLLPFLTVVGQVLGSLASAVLGDLVSAFTALATLLTDIAPSLKIVASVLGQVFTTLENSGVFADLGNVLEAVVTPLSKLINLLVAQLAPLLPVIITIVSQFANILVNLLAAGLTSVLEGITWLLTKMPWLVPLLASITIGVWAFNAALAANPIGLVVIAVVGLIGAITLLVTHWTQVWGDIKHWAEDAWNFIYNGFGKYLLPLLGPVGLIALGALELYQHWNTVWGAIKQVGLDFYQWIWSDFGAKIANFLTNTLPNAFTSAVNAISSTWGSIEGIFKTPVNFLINTVYMGGIRRFWDDVMGAIGLSSLNLPVVNGLAAGGVITSGTGPTSDDVLIRASRGETVVSAAHSAVLAPVFAAVGVPGYAGGGVVGVPSIVGQILSSAVSSGVKDLGNELLKLIGVPAGTGGDLAKMLVGIPTTIISKAANWALSAIGLGGGGGGGTAGSPSGGAPAANALLARQLAAAGLAPSWASGADWISWNNIAMAESGWNNFARNPSSGAYGIPQALPYTKMPKLAWPASAGGSSDPSTQIAWMINYIQSVYGTPETAWGHEQAFHWYGGGLDAIFNHPTVIGVGERGPEAVSVTPLASYGAKGGGSAGLLQQLIAAINNERPMIGTYQTAFYGTGDTAYALRELTSTLRLSQLQSVVGGP